MQLMGGTTTIEKTATQFSVLLTLKNREVLNLSFYFSYERPSRLLRTNTATTATHAAIRTATGNTVIVSPVLTGFS